MSAYLSASLRKKLIETDDHRCAYCRTAETASGHPMVVDHILPRSKGGMTELDNLCFACHRCNQYKRATIALIDPVTGDEAQLFHPRQQLWAEHFRWDASGVRIVGLTPSGRVTVLALNMNNELITSARRNWVGAGWHPPLEQTGLAE